MGRRRLWPQTRRHRCVRTHWRRGVACQPGRRLSPQQTRNHVENVVVRHRRLRVARVETNAELQRHGRGTDHRCRQILPGCHRTETTVDSRRQRRSLRRLEIHVLQIRGQRRHHERDLCVGTVSVELAAKPTGCEVEETVVETFVETTTLVEETIAEETVTLGTSEQITTVPTVAPEPETPAGETTPSSGETPASGTGAPFNSSATSLAVGTSALLVLLALFF